jgi:predicted DNA-binding transcriptional regulator YafY
VTAQEVADELEVSTSTARRDLEALSIAGIPSTPSRAATAAGRWSAAPAQI